MVPENAAADASDSAEDFLFGPGASALAEVSDDEDDEDDEQAPPRRIAEVSATRITPAEFEARYVRCGRPAVLTGCEAEAWWPGWLTLEYLAAQYGGARVGLDGAKAPTSSLGAFIGGLDAETRYCRNVHLGDVLSARDVARLAWPAPLGANALATTRAAVPDAWRHWFELFVLPRRCVGYPFLHVDACSTHAFSLQLRGVKRFTLFAPDDAPFLYARPPTYCRSALPDGAPYRVDLARWPQFAKARPVTVDLRPGSLLFLPRHWWHIARPAHHRARDDVGGGGPDDHGLTLGGNFVSPGATEAAFLDDWADFALMKDLAAGRHRAAAIWDH